MHIRINSNRYKTFLIVFLSFTLYFNSFSQAYAATVGGWSLSNAVAQGASTVYDATKNVVINGKNYIKDSWVKITPNATQVAKVLARGGAGYALSVAVEQLIGSVDWVLDPANNQIKWKEGGTIGGKYIFLCTESINGCPANSSMINKTPFNPTASSQWRDVCASQAASMGGTVHSNSRSETCIVTVGGSNTFYGIGTRTIEGEEGEEKTLPLPVVAEKVISNAEGGDANAQVATTAAAADIVAEAEKDEVKARPIANQAEANAETKPADEAEAEKANEAQGQSKPNESNPEAMDISLEFPVFCNWAPTVCQAAQVVISFPQTLTGWYTDTKTKAEEWASSIAQSWATAREYFEKEPEPQQEEPIQIQDPAIDISVTNYIQGNAYCPNDREIPLSMGSHTLNLVISYQPLCSVAQQFKPAVILMAFLAGAFIITNTGRRAEVGD